MMNIDKLIAEMTLEEKASLLSGEGFWHTKSVDRLGIPAMMMSDGPHGLRKQAPSEVEGGIDDTVKAVCFPSGCATASSFDTEVLYELGQSLGRACLSENVGMILGPGTNIKRSPLCGRNFEYFSEDPYLASRMAAAHIRGTQSMGVGTSLKHFALNNQEIRRMSVSSEVDERTMHEIYLAAFETAVREAKPWTLMCSYNRVNGVFASENEELLTKILRDTWGFEGCVVSDWAAVSDRVRGVAAGLDLEMPGSAGERDALIVKAVKEGRLDIAAVDTAVRRVLELVDKAVTGSEAWRADPNRKEWNRDEDHELARGLAARSAVLLKNEGGILPLAENARVAVIGAYAQTPRFQGGGSSHINCHKVTSFMDCVADNPGFTFAKGFEGDRDERDDALFAEAIAAAKEADVALIFAGLPDSFESEGGDRAHMAMPNCQNDLIREIVAVQPNSVVILHNGSPVEMPWADDVKGILEMYLGGQAVGGATYDLLTGAVNPSGRLAETIPYRLEDNPSYGNFPGDDTVVRYGEGILVGYRYYDYKKMPVRFPFGYGLSYTTFDYEKVELSTNAAAGGCEADDEKIVNVTVTIRNTGSVTGSETVQLYIAPKNSPVMRPIRELKGFEKVELMPGESRQVTFALSLKSFAYYETKVHNWYAPAGEYTIEIGRSSREIVLSENFSLTGGLLHAKEYDMDSLIGDMMNDERIADYVARTMADKFINFSDDELKSDASLEERKKKLAGWHFYTPIRAGLSFSNGKLGVADIEAFLNEINAMIK